MTGEEIRRNPVEELAEEFLQRYRRGERPALGEYTGKYPELADEIRDLFPALVMMEEAGQPALPQRRLNQVTADGRVPQQLGEYRILREVGRGGMGVVYEAEHAALGRHVALKVLPFEAAANPTSLERFRREARSAARLHHTNIVPVFDVGEHQGIPYYAMQFIQGQSLGEIFAELRHLRGRHEPTGCNLTADLADSLLTGRCHAEATAGTVAVVHPPSDLSAQSDFHYYRSVARLGQQAAEALAYAHDHKILHRDIKPANLLLDLQGTVWVTDFGLAKEAGDDLTHTGDVVGTLRYMAPERFNGVSDARSDVYSLGLTLYELLTLRPAFDEADRGQLVRQIADTQPLPPRHSDPRVPRDLETIVLKAIEKEPGRRYQSAQALADDLRRFEEATEIARSLGVLGDYRIALRNEAIACLSLADLRVDIATLPAPDRASVWWPCFSPDGLLLATATESHGVHLWNLGALGEKLGTMGLGCELLPNAPAPTRPGLSRVRVFQDVQEAEYFKVQTESWGTYVQDVKRWGRHWSNDKQLICNAEKGSYVELALEVPQSGSYRLAACLSRSWNFGVVEVALDGKKIGATFEGYQGEIRPPIERIDYGTFALEEGAHRLRFTAVDRHPKSAAACIGIDYIQLTPVDTPRKRDTEGEQR